MRQVGASIAVDRHGYPVIAGAFHGTLDLGVATLNGPAVPPSEGDIFPEPPLALEGRLFVARLAPCRLRAVRARRRRDLRLHRHHPGRARWRRSHPAHRELHRRRRFRRRSGERRSHVDGDRQAHCFWRPRLEPRIRRLSDDRHASRDGCAGHVYVAGFFSGWLGYDDITLGEGTSFGHDGFVAKLDPSGALVWWKILALESQPVAGRTSPSSRGPRGDVAVAGQIVTSPGQLSISAAGP
ncbi:MAG: hypothetical protein IPM54_11895 [Polyangiaceae bacterium]|nr:hypothetical protein [Polyangiaceae bacterium]